MNNAFLFIKHEDCYRLGLKKPQRTRHPNHTISIRITQLSHTKVTINNM